ncbi:unnamed protein product [Peniophora sp. CBMAI 1063]|nr:unnamed protein product [Peniophora sp. CBMAI 1063]
MASPLGRRASSVDGIQYSFSDRYSIRQGPPFSSALALRRLLGAVERSHTRDVRVASIATGTGGSSTRLYLQLDSTMG